MKYKLNVGILILVVISFTACKKNVKEENQHQDIYTLLENALHERKRNLINYMNESRSLAKKLQSDQNMISFFKTKRDYYYLKKESKVPGNLDQQIEKLKENINDYYIINYQSFYDVLFVDTKGEIFYTIKKEADYHKNIFRGELSKTKLSKKLKNFTDESFVDFQFYKVSGEPSAFFIEPVLDNDKTIGWFILQLSINKINNLFSISKNLGRTGELLLVNKDHYLLTDSRFNVEPTILKQQLPKQNIDAKFKEQTGSKVVIDYRGKKAYTVFEVFDFFDSEWLIIAKIDKNEIITNQYEESKEKYYPVLENKLKGMPIKTYDLSPGITSYEMVDMDEYRRKDTSAVLFTKGVSSCTAITVIYPGKFTYLAHISPYDEIYNRERTDIMAQMFKQINYFDITESERQKLHFYVTSTQFNSLENLIQKIVDNGYFLSQIKFTYNSKASYANVYSDCLNNKVQLQWVLKNKTGKASVYQDFDSVMNLQQVILNE